MSRETVDIFSNMRSMKESMLKIAINTSQKQDQFAEDALLNTEEFEVLMKISSSTAYKWREEGIIAFYQIKSKIYYKMKHVNIMLAENYVPSKNEEMQVDNNLKK